MPGVILELEYNFPYGQYLVKKIEFSPHHTEPIALPTEGFKITKEQMLSPGKNPINEKEVKAYFKKNH